MPTSTAQEIATARENLRVCRALYAEASDDERKEATVMLIEAKKVWERVAPPTERAAVPQAARRGVDPAIEASHIRAAREQDAQAVANDTQLGAYLEPELQRLLAEQTLRGEALKWSQQLLKWLREASANCANNQPVLARRYVDQALAELMVMERALKEAPVQAPSRKKGGKKKPVPTA